jgi:hypothetical protein
MIIGRMIIVHVQPYAKTPYPTSKITKAKRAGIMGQVVEHLSSNLSTEKNRFFFKKPDFPLESLQIKEKIHSASLIY